MKNLLQSYKIYKGVSGKFGALQFSLQPSERSKKGTGCVFIEAAKPLGPNEYDWENKIVMALNISDIGTLVYSFRNPPQGSVDIYHDTFAGTERQGEVVKIFKIGKMKTGWFVAVVNKHKNNKHEVKLPISDSEAVIIETLLETAIPKVLGW